MEELYKEYCKELSQYDNEEFEEGSDVEMLDAYLQMDGCKVIEIKQDKKLVGFLITLQNYFMHKELAILEAYILPEYRCKGLMTKAVNKAVNRVKHKNVKMLVYNRNPAKEFWKKLMSDMGYRHLSTFPFTENITEYYFWRR